MKPNKNNGSECTPWDTSEEPCTGAPHKDSHGHVETVWFTSIHHDGIGHAETGGENITERSTINLRGWDAVCDISARVYTMIQ